MTAPTLEIITDVPKHPKYWDDYKDQDFLAKVLNDHELITLLKSYLADLTYYDLEQNVPDNYNDPHQTSQDHQYYSEVSAYLAAQSTSDASISSELAYKESVFTITDQPYSTTYLILPFAYSILVLVFAISILSIASLISRCYRSLMTWIESDDIEPFNIYMIQRCIKIQAVCQSSQNHTVGEYDIGFHSDREDEYEGMIGEIYDGYTFKFYGGHHDEVTGDYRDDSNYLADTEDHSTSNSGDMESNSIFSNALQKSILPNDFSFHTDDTEKESQRGSGLNKGRYESSFENADVFGSGIEDLREVVERPLTSTRERHAYIFESSCTDIPTKEKGQDQEHGYVELPSTISEKAKETASALFFKRINDQTNVYLMQEPSLVNEYLDTCYPIAGESQELLGVSPLLVEDEDEDEDEGETYESDRNSTTYNISNGSVESELIQSAGTLIDVKHFSDIENYRDSEIIGRLSKIRIRLSDDRDNTSLYRMLISKLNVIYEILATQLNASNDFNHRVRLSFIGILNDLVIYQNDNALSFSLFIGLIENLVSMLNRIDIIGMSMESPPSNSFELCEFNFIMHVLIQVLTCISFDHLLLIIGDIYKEEKCNNSGSDNDVVKNLNWIDFEILKVLVCYNFDRLTDNPGDFKGFSLIVSNLLPVNGETSTNGFELIWNKILKSWDYKVNFAIINSSHLQVITILHPDDIENYDQNILTPSKSLSSSINRRKSKAEESEKKKYLEEINLSNQAISE